MPTIHYTTVYFMVLFYWNFKHSYCSYIVDPHS